MPKKKRKEEEILPVLVENIRYDNGNSSYRYGFFSTKSTPAAVVKIIKIYSRYRQFHRRRDRSTATHAQRYRLSFICFVFRELFFVRI